MIEHISHILSGIAGILIIIVCVNILRQQSEQKKEQHPTMRKFKVYGNGLPSISDPPPPPPNRDILIGPFGSRVETKESKARMKEWTDLMDERARQYDKHGKMGTK